MKPHGVIKLFIFLMVVVVAGFVAFSLVGADTPAVTESRQIDRLFEDLGVLKVPPGIDPVTIRLKDLNGNPVDLADFRGEIVFLNFWTTWCPTCRVEMPSMEKLHQKMRNKAFAMVAVNIQEPASRVKQFFKQYQLTFTTLMDASGQVAAGFGIRAIPTTLILDKTGRIIGSIQGPREWDGKKSIAMFEHLIDSDPVSPVMVPDK